MSDLTFNKIAGGVLATFLTIFLLREGSAMVFERTEAPEHPGYKIDVPADLAGGAGGPAAPAGPPDWAAVLPAADIAAGQEVATSRCGSCHNFVQGGPNGTGPNLFGVLGRRPGSHAGFAYSPAMVASATANPTWSYDHLYEFIGAPQRVVEGTRMTYAGLRDPEQRIQLIAYLRSIGSTNVPIPAPRPAAAEGATNAAAPAAGATNAAAAPTNAAAATNAAAPAAPTNAAAPAPTPATTQASPVAAH